MKLFFSVRRMQSFLRTIGITIACAVVILAANVAIYSNQAPALVNYATVPHAGFQVVMFLR
jgi:hypothetical protein